MAHVTVNINGRRYDIACDDGQEAHLIGLSRYVSKRVGELAAAVGGIGESRLLVMASLLMADELSDTHAELDGLRKSDHGATAHAAEAEETLAERINILAERIEVIADRLEQL